MLHKIYIVYLKNGKNEILADNMEHIIIIIIIIRNKRRTTC